MTNPIDVLIVGAGPAGLTLACDLARRGVRARLIEAAAAPMIASKGKALQPRTLEVFDDLGIAAQVMAAGRPYPPLRFYNGREPVRDVAMMTHREPSEAEPYSNTLLIPQWKTEELLRARLEALGGKVEFDTRFESLAQGADGVTAILATATGPVCVRAAYVIAADGGRSSVRRAIGVRLEGETPQGSAMLVADVLADGLDREHWHMWASAPQTTIGLCPLPSTDAFQVYGGLADGQELPQDPQALQALLNERLGDTGVVVRQVLSSSLYRPNLRMADRFGVGRVFLVGDAAHVHPPTGGQGLNTSVQDAYNLGWKLEAALRGDATILDTYEAERLPIAAAVLGRSDLLFKRGLTEEGMKRGEDEQQLRLNYRGGPLAQGEAFGPLQPGDRMPNAWLRGPDGGIATLFGLMRGPHATLLAIGAKPPKANPLFAQTKVVSVGKGPGFDFEPAGEVLAGLSGQVLTIRPDGYLLEVAQAL